MSVDLLFSLQLLATLAWAAALALGAPIVARVWRGDAWLADLDRLLLWFAAAAIECGYLRRLYYRFDYPAMNALEGWSQAGVHVFFGAVGLAVAGRFWRLGR